MGHGRLQRGLLEQRVEGSARILRRRRGLLRGELLPFAGLEVRAVVRLRLLHHQGHLGLAALRRRTGIEVGAVGAGVQIGATGGAARCETRGGTDALKLTAARTAESARGGRTEAAAARRVARIPGSGGGARRAGKALAGLARGVARR